MSILNKFIRVCSSDICRCLYGVFACVNIKVAKVAITRDRSQLSNRLLIGNIVGHRYSGGAIPLESRIFIEQNKCLRSICLFVFLLTHFLRFLKKELL